MNKGTSSIEKMYCAYCKKDMPLNQVMNSMVCSKCSTIIYRIDTTAASSNEGEKETRVFYIDEIRKNINLLLKEEMSMSRFVEILNEKATGLPAIELCKRLHQPPTPTPDAGEEKRIVRSFTTWAFYSDWVRITKDSDDWFCPRTNERLSFDGLYVRYLETTQPVSDAE